VRNNKNIILDISIVVYATPRVVLTNCLFLLAESVRYAQNTITGLDVNLYFIVNDEFLCEEQVQLFQSLLNSYCPNINNYIYHGHGNIGYGRGHNLAISQSESDIFLVLNPDVFIDKVAIHEGISFLEQHKDVGLVAPLVVNENNEIQYLCKSYPSIMVLFLRMFFSDTSIKPFRRLLDDYEMRNIINAQETVFDIPLVSGCFMLFNTSTLKHLGGFSDNYFMYFEDYDLSLRAAALSKISYYPKIKVAHLGGGASKKGFKHIKMFIISAFRFFNIHGWKLY
jgi:GT2 family glycosyltransferase